MGQRLDRIAYHVSVIYIALPIYMFLVAWLRPMVSIPVSIVFIVSCVFLFRNKPAAIEWHLTRETRVVALISIFILMLWLYFSGLGGFSFQKSDYHYRNAIFHDLMNRSWPVIYDYSAESLSGAPDKAILTYYIAFWLPAAAVGKLFGWVAANFFLYLWSLLGGTLIIYYLFRTLRNARVWSVLILIFFSGADILGYLWLTNGKWPGLMEHMEWWSGLQYSSNTTLLYWVFNQTIVMWLAILLVLNLPNSRSLFFLYAMLLLHGPFPFLGMLPFVLWKAYEGYPLRLGAQGLESGKKGFPYNHPVYKMVFWFWNGIRRALSFENICGGIPVLLICYLYLSNNVSSQKMGTNPLSTHIILFFFFDAGLFLWVLYSENKRNPLYWLCMMSLAVIPFFRVGISQDFCMRVSIPALFMLQILVQKALFQKKDLVGVPAIEASKVKSEEKSKEKSEELQTQEQPPERSRKTIKVLLIVLLVIGMAVPLQEINRSTTHTLLSYSMTHEYMENLGYGLVHSDNLVVAQYGQEILAWQGEGRDLWADSVGTLAYNKDNVANFIGPTQDNFFYMYLARQD